MTQEPVRPRDEGVPAEQIDLDLESRSHAAMGAESAEATLALGLGESDEVLLDRVRAGDSEAYAALYERHSPAALRLARAGARHLADADDIVSEAFARVLERIKAGGGPELAFRPYLLTTVRRLILDRARRQSRVQLADDGAMFEALPDRDDAIQRGVEGELIRHAFSSLPERWQAVLWHTEVEGESAAVLAPVLGISPNSVSALAYRAREGLRQAYLRAHVNRGVTSECEKYVDKLAAYVRRSLGPRDTAAVEAHLQRCAECRDRGGELMLIATDFRGLLAPALLGWLAAKYVSTVHAGQGSIATSAVGTGAAASGSDGVMGVSATGQTATASATGLSKAMVGSGIAAAVACAIALPLAFRTPADEKALQPPAAVAGPTSGNEQPGTESDEIEPAEGSAFIPIGPSGLLVPSQEVTRVAEVPLGPLPIASAAPDIPVPSDISAPTPSTTATLSPAPPPTDTSQPTPEPTSVPTGATRQVTTRFQVSVLDLGIASNVTVTLPEGWQLVDSSAPNGVSTGVGADATIALFGIPGWLLGNLGLSVTALGPDNGQDATARVRHSWLLGSSEWDLALR